MAKTIPSGLASRFGSTADKLAHWAGCLLITRKDGISLGFTDHDQDLVVSGVTYKAAMSYSRTAVRGSSDMSVDSLDVTGPVLDSDDITQNDLDAGIYEGGTYQIFLVDWSNVSAGIIKIRTGSIGQVQRGNAAYTMELRGLSQALSTYIGDFYSGTCRADLGDAKCTINLAPLTQTGTVTAVTDLRTFTASGLTGAGPRTISYTASTIAFKKPKKIEDTANGFITAGFALDDPISISGSSNGNDAEHTILSLSAGQIGTASDVYKEPGGRPITISTRTSDYFAGGEVAWRTGANTGLKSEVRTWDGTSALVLLLPSAYTIAIGDTFTITPGCDKLVQTCVAKFNNILNFRGEPRVPGQDAILVYPD